MALETAFLPLSIDELIQLVASRKKEGWRFVQLLGVSTDEGVDLQYSFYKDGIIENYTIPGMTKEQRVPSITDYYLAAFVFENETHDLFGVQIDDIAIDFEGSFYALSQPAPMTNLSPAQKEAREKAAKIAAAKARAEKKSAAGPETPSVWDIPADLEAKLASMDPEKAAKVRAAWEAKKNAEREKEAKLNG